MDPFLENIALVGPKKAPKAPPKAPSKKTPLNHSKLLTPKKSK